MGLSSQVQGLTTQLLRWSEAITEITNSFKVNHADNHEWRVEHTSTPELQNNVLMDEENLLDPKGENCFRLGKLTCWDETHN